MSSRSAAQNRSVSFTTHRSVGHACSYEPKDSSDGDLVSCIVTAHNVSNIQVSLQWIVQQSRAPESAFAKPFMTAGRGRAMSSSSHSLMLPSPCMCCVVVIPTTVHMRGVLANVALDLNNAFIICVQQLSGGERRPCGDPLGARSHACRKRAVGRQQPFPLTDGDVCSDNGTLSKNEFGPGSVVDKTSGCGSPWVDVHR